jgi:hypothetical protein
MPGANTGGTTGCDSAPGSTTRKRVVTYDEDTSCVEVVTCDEDTRCVEVVVARGAGLPFARSWTMRRNVLGDSDFRPQILRANIPLIPTGRSFRAATALGAFASSRLGPSASRGARRAPPRAGARGGRVSRVSPRAPASLALGIRPS